VGSEEEERARLPSCDPASCLPLARSEEGGKLGGRVGSATELRSRFMPATREKRGRWEARREREGGGGSPAARRGSDAGGERPSPAGLAPRRSRPLLASTLPRFHGVGGDEAVGVRLPSCDPASCLPLARSEEGGKRGGREGGGGSPAARRGLDAGGERPSPAWLAPRRSRALLASTLPRFQGVGGDDLPRFQGVGGDDLPRFHEETRRWRQSTASGAASFGSPISPRNIA